MFKNIIYIAGNDSYGIEQEVKRWLLAFSSKYGDVNIDRFRLEEIKNTQDIYDQLFTTGLFVEKRLFLFSGGATKKSKTGGIEEILERYANTIPEDHFCLFHNISDGEEKLSLWLEKNADTRKINTLWDREAWKKRFGEIDGKTIVKVLETYEYGEKIKEPGEKTISLGHTIFHTFMKFSLADKNTAYQEILEKEGGGKMFDLIDSILNCESKKAIEMLKKLLEKSSSIEVLNSLIGLLRSHLYIQVLLASGTKKENIEHVVKVHPFIVKKSFGARIGKEKLQILMSKLYSANKAYKSGRGLKDAELGRIFSIELALMGLKK